MILLTPAQTATLKDWFLPERPGPLIGSHVIQTGQGTCHVDRWPHPRAVLMDTAGNYSLRGDPNALSPADLQSHLAGFVDTSPDFVPLLKAAFPEVIEWPRVIFEWRAAPRLPAPSAYPLRRLEPADLVQLQGLSPEVDWIAKTWGGMPGLAASGFAWGAFVGGQLAAVACSFFVGQMYEDIGVITEPEFRGLGLSTACAGMLCGDIQARGHQPSWSTSLDNTASIRVAEKLGFVLQRHAVLYIVGIDIPAPAASPTNE